MFFYQHFLFVNSKTMERMFISYCLNSVADEETLYSIETR